MNETAASPVDEEAESDQVKDAETPADADPAPGVEDQPPDAASGGEKPQRRRELREFEVTGSVTIKGEAFPLKDWSSSGFGVGDCKLAFEENERLGIDFSITLASGLLAFSCKAIIVRSDEDSGDAAGAFVEMRREDRVMVARYFDSMEDGPGEDA